MERKKTCCFTGKRPQDMPWGYDETDPECVSLKSEIENMILKAIDCGYTHFITGMAQGVDIFAGELVAELKNTYPVTLEAAIPCRRQTAKWPWEQVERYNKLLSRCDMITYVSEKYTPYCMMERNMYMVDNSAVLIAVYNGTGGGTQRTMKYAARQGVTIWSVDF